MSTTIDPRVNNFSSPFVKMIACLPIVGNFISGMILKDIHFVYVDISRNAVRADRIASLNALDHHTIDYLHAEIVNKVSTLALVITFIVLNVFINLVIVMNAVQVVGLGTMFLDLIYIHSMRNSARNEPKLSQT